MAYSGKHDKPSDGHSIGTSLGRLAELKKYSDRSDYVLPARARSRAEHHGEDTHVSKDTVRECIDYWIREYKPDVRRFTPHDLRSAMKSHMRALGVPRNISEMCLNHSMRLAFPP